METEKSFTYLGKKISYRVSGSGPAVVLIHGLPAESGLWRQQVTAINGFTFFVPDLPGSGQSEMIPDMSMEGMAEVIKAMLDEEKIKTTALVGHSMGGYISLAFAEKYSAMLNGIGLIHSTAFADNDERKANRKKGIASVEKNGVFDFLKTLIPNLFSAESKQRFEHTQGKNPMGHLIEQANNFSDKALVSYYEAMMNRPDRTEVLKNIKIPVLFIAGNSDTAIPLKDLLQQCHLPEISYFHILASSGHLGMLEEPEKTSFILNDYLINLS